MLGQPEKLAGKAILVVEDDFLIALGIARSFEDEGARVLGPVGRIDDALALMEEAGRIDAAVLDINLHNTLVFPVADALSARGVPFVFATGYDGSIVPERHRGAPRCQKPVLPEALCAALFA